MCLEQVDKYLVVPHFVKNWYKIKKCIELTLQIVHNNPIQPFSYTLCALTIWDRCMQFDCPSYFILNPFILTLHKLHKMPHSAAVDPYTHCHRPFIPSPDKISGILLLQMKGIFISVIHSVTISLWLQNL